MKQFLIALFLLGTAAPLFATDEGGDGATIPDYRELVREGYGPRDHDRAGYLLLQSYGVAMAPKPTQAYYGKGYTIYYGYTAVPVRRSEANSCYAFGYSLDYFQHLLPASINDGQLAHYAVEVRKSIYAPGEFVTQNQRRHDNAVTTAQSVPAAAPASATGAPLPVAEKTAR